MLTDFFLLYLLISILVKIYVLVNTLGAYIFFFILVFFSKAGKTRTKDKYRVVYTDQQRVELEKEFLYNKYITIKRKTEMAQGLGLSERQVSLFFFLFPSYNFGYRHSETYTKIFGYNLSHEIKRHYEHTMHRFKLRNHSYFTAFYFFIRQ